MVEEGLPWAVDYLTTPHPLTPAPFSSTLGPKAPQPNPAPYWHALTHALLESKGLVVLSLTFLNVREAPFVYWILSINIYSTLN